MPSKDHLHTYTRFRKDYYRCMDPHCTHFTRKEMLLGKAAACPVCKKEFVLDREALRRALPKCLDCSETKVSRVRKAARSAIESIFDQGEET